MQNEPTDDDLRRLPTLFSDLKKPAHCAIIYEHFTLNRSHWYAAEYDPNTRTFFGFSIYDAKPTTGAWCLFGLDQLRSARVHGRVVERDTHWQPRPASDVAEITAAYRARGWRL